MDMRNKLCTIAIILFMGLLIFQNSYVSATGNNYNYILNEDFEGYQDEDIPTSLEIINPISDISPNSYIKVGRITDRNRIAQKGLIINRVSGSSTGPPMQVYKQIDTPLTGIVVWEFTFLSKASSSSRDNDFIIYSGNDEIFKVHFKRPSGVEMRYSLNGINSDYKTVAQYNEYFNLRFEINTNTQKITVFNNDEILWGDIDLSETVQNGIDKVLFNYRDYTSFETILDDIKLYSITPVYFENNLGENITFLGLEEGDITVKADIKNNSDEEMTMVLIVAVCKRETDEVYNMKINSITLAPTQEDILEATVNIFDIEDFYISAFIWESFGSLIPIEDNYILQ